jgi:hypothetical protein
MIKLKTIMVALACALGFAAVAVRGSEPAVRPALQVEIALFRIAQERSTTSQNTPALTASKLRSIMQTANV